MKDFVKYLEDIPTDTKDTLNLVDSVLPLFKEAMQEESTQETVQEETVQEEPAQETVQEEPAQETVQKTISFIGFEGSWGSGKTSVLKALQNENLYKEYIFFFFSAWSSNNDSIKRDFIHKLETTITKNSNPVSKPSQIFEWILVTIFIFGIWIGIGEIIFNLLKDTWIYNIVPDWFKWGVIGLLTLASAYILGKSTGGDTSGIIRTFLPIQETTPSTDIPDYEFIDKLTKLVNKQNQKLCIVLDNIDRLMSDQIESSLSLLYSLKDFSQDFSEDPSKKEGVKTSIIVPYDAVQLDNIFYNVIPQKEGSKDPNLDNILLAEDYVNRVFPIKISIPLLTNHEMLKKIYSNLYRAGFKIFDDQAELTDDDISIMEKLHTYINNLVPINKMIVFTTNIRDNFTIGDKTIIFDEIFISYSQNLNIPIDIDDDICLKLENKQESRDSIQYQDINTKDELIEILKIALMKKYNELIKDSTNTDFYKMKKLYCYYIYVTYYIKAMDYPSNPKARDKYNNWRNPRYQIQQINKMVHYRMSFEQKFKDHEVITSDKENIFDVLFLCYQFELNKRNRENYANVTTWSHAYKDMKYDDFFIQ